MNEMNNVMRAWTAVLISKRKKKPVNLKDKLFEIIQSEEKKNKRLKKAYINYRISSNKTIFVL